MYFCRSRDQTTFLAPKQTWPLQSCLRRAFQISRTIDQYARKLPKLAKQVLLAELGLGVLGLDLLWERTRLKPDKQRMGLYSTSFFLTHVWLKRLLFDTTNQLQRLPYCLEKFACVPEARIMFFLVVHCCASKFHIFQIPPV